MLPLPPFEWLAPTAVDDVLRLLAQAPGETRLLAGGTDLVPNLKLGLLAPRRLVGLRRVRELGLVEDAPGGGLVIGAGVTLDALARDARVRDRYPALADAAGQVASPQVRRMGTLGGNLCLDTRCGYYNQTEFWRGALGGCIKTGGPVCHVVPHGKRCVAAFSADTPIPLLALGASVDLASVRGVRSLPLASFYAGDGLRNVVLAPDELVLRVHVPAPVPGSVSAFVKLRLRRAIDFPLLSMAAVTTRRDDGRFDGVSLVVGALGSLPRRVQGLDREGRPVLLDDVADAASAQCRPLSNADSPAWRKEVIGPLVRRLLSSLPR